MATKTFFEYLIISLVLLWPIWALAFVFLRWLLEKAHLFSRDLKSEAPALSQRKERPKPIEKRIKMSHAPQRG